MFRRSAVASLLLIVIARAPAQGGDAPAALASYEDLLEVVAVLTWHLRDDLYRFPAPKDPTGHDVFRLALERLQHWEQRFPDRQRDVTAFARARALERLSEYQKAADAYGTVVASGSPLADAARSTLPRAKQFAEAAALPEDDAALDLRLKAIRTKLDVWSGLVRANAGTPYEAIARTEEERLERLAARLVIEQRHTLTDGYAASERALRYLIDKHAESKFLASYVLSLGDLYADVARDYASNLDGHPLAFDEGEFVRRADRALETYRKIATWDGAPEKPEGQARYAAIEAYKASVLAEHR